MLPSPEANRTDCPAKLTLEGHKAEAQLEAEANRVASSVTCGSDGKKEVSSVQPIIASNSAKEVFPHLPCPTENVALPPCFNMKYVTLHHAC